MKRTLFFLLILISVTLSAQQGCKLKVGAERIDRYFPLLTGKRVAVMTNQTGMAGDEHLVDLLLRHRHNLVGIFSPEHGFRGTADA
ncbi:MAG: exo-beta-N-acetylmuramidase NamZ domain-containing protein, partial [Proteiniphilum sp.]